MNEYRFLDEKTILITGGTGSFGKKIARRLLDSTNVAKVIIYSRDELKQFDMKNEFGPSSKLRFFIGDVRDYQRLCLAFSGVDFVVHAAAMKHVEASEYNPTECIKTNVDGAMNVINAAIFSGVKKVVALSTDKACNPTNLYGASKLASDKLFIAANNLSGGSVSFGVVRYGNVAGSRGSVIPYFQRLLKKGAVKLPVTDTAMTRFWITLEQGIDYVLSCMNELKGGETFIPKLPSFRVVDLVEALIGENGYEVVGIRPGEKLHEVMFSSDDFSRVIERKNDFVLLPSISFSGPDLSDHFDTVPTNVRYMGGYASDSNDQFLSVRTLAEFCS